jgi:hypothetical protein
MVSARLPDSRQGLEPLAAADTVVSHPDNDDKADDNSGVAHAHVHSIITKHNARLQSCITQAYKKARTLLNLCRHAVRSLCAVEGAKLNQDCLHLAGGCGGCPLHRLLPMEPGSLLPRPCWLGLQRLVQGC